MLERRRLGPALELVLGRGRVPEETAHRIKLIRARQVGRTRDRKLVVGEIRPGAHERQRLDRLRRRPDVRDQRRVASLHDRATVLHGNRMHAVPCLDDSTTLENDLYRELGGGSRGHDARA